MLKKRLPLFRIESEVIPIFSGVSIVLKPIKRIGQLLTGTDMNIGTSTINRFGINNGAGTNSNNGGYTSNRVEGR